MRQRPSIRFLVGVDTITGSRFLNHAAATIRWRRFFDTPRKIAFIIRGEPDAADELRQRISMELSWRSVVPDYNQAESLA